MNKYLINVTKLLLLSKSSLFELNVCVTVFALSSEDLKFLYYFVKFLSGFPSIVKGTGTSKITFVVVTVPMNMVKKKKFSL